MADERTSMVGSPGSRFNGGRGFAADLDAPLRHVIDEYRHREQVVTCVCGWHGSTVGELGGRSPWDDHKAEFRTGRR